MSNTTQARGTTAVGGGIAAALTILVVAEVVAAFETTMAIQLLYSPGDFFTTDLSKLVWVVTAYSLVAALATGFVGRLGDQFGRAKVLVVILAISAVGSIVSALAPSFGVLIAGRALQGVTGAVLPLCIGIVRATFPAARIALGVAVVSTSALIAGAAGMLLGGIFLDYATWHVIFWSAAALAIFAGVLVRMGIPREPRSTLATSGRVDYIGGLLFGASIATALYGLTLAKERGWTDGSVLAFVACGLLGLVLWTMWELRNPSPMIDIRMFGERKFALGMLATALIALGPIGMTTILTVTLYRTPNAIPLPDGSTMSLPVGLGLSATMTGVVGFVTAAASFATAPLIGRISTRYGARTGLMIGAAFTIVGLLIVCISPTSIPVVLAGMIVVVLGTGFLYSGMPTVIVECVLPEQTSTATGVNAVTRTTFQAVSASLVALLLASSPVMLGENAFTSRTGLHLVVGACILTCLLTIAVVSRIPATTVADAPVEAPAGAALKD